MPLSFTHHTIVKIASGRLRDLRSRDARLVFLALFLLLSWAAAYGQTTITGRVRDARTLQPMQFASVYLNLTTIGVYADDDGRFTLKNIPAGRYDLIVSHVGYQTYQARIDAKGDSTVLEVDVKLISQTLKAVTITSARDSRWKAQLQRFHTLFFGNSRLSKDCRILNPWVLNFKEDATHGLTAEAGGDLKIENLSLGYALSYQLKKFQSTSTHYVISGVSWFREIPTLDTALINLWDRRRRESYAGSFRHLLKAIQTDRLAQEGFDLYEDITNSDDVVRKAYFVSNLDRSIVPIPPGSIVAEKNDDLYTIQMPSKTEVHFNRRKAIPKVYRNIAVPISWIEVKGGKLEVNDYGMVLNSADVMISGEMGEARISSLLPFDYAPKRVVDEQSKRKKTIVSTLSKASELVLLERPYLQTDKSFYYGDESVWFKAYMNYYSRVYSDTLSKVLYVDLVDVKKRVVTTKIFPIDSTGTVRGSIRLQALRAGDYQLRAYTQWLLNLDRSLMYTKSIKVLAVDEAPVPEAMPLDSVSPLEIVTSASTVRAGEDFSFSVQAKNEYGFLHAGSLSVAIVPARYVAIGTRESGIMQQFVFPDDVLRRPFPKQPEYTIQQGIDVSGRVTMPAKRKKKKKKKDSEPIVVFSQPGTDDLFHITPEADGVFRLPALQLFDSARLSAQALILRDGRQLPWTIDSVSISPTPDAFEVLSAALVKMPVKREPVYEMDSTLSVRVLDEVTVTDTRPREVKGSSVHLSADIVISGESLRNADNGDFLSLLQSRVPGLRVLTLMQGGIMMKMLKLGGINSFGQATASHEPLVMVDGMVLNGFGQTAADQLSGMTASSIERIEVIKFGGGAAYGARGANGVISIYTNNLTRTDKTDDGPIDKSLYRPVNIPGFASPTVFRMPRFDPSLNYDGSTIYWNPSVMMDGKSPASLSFNVPNVAGDYVIVVEGVTTDGKPLRSLKSFSVFRE